MSDQFVTDFWLLRVFDGWFDPCPLNDVPVFDGLSVDWGCRAFVNPPYSDPLPWVLKAIEERDKGCVVVMLLKADHTTKWYRALRDCGAHFLDIGERLHHGGKYAAPFPSVLVVL
jgi:hypothetical protein